MRHLGNVSNLSLICPFGSQTGTNTKKKTLHLWHVSWKKTKGFLQKYVLQIVQDFLVKENFEVQ